MFENLFSKLSGVLGRKPGKAIPASAPAAKTQARPQPDPRQNLILTLQDGIRRLHKCESSFAESQPVTLDVNGKIVWQGRVEVFVLKGHPKAKRCYAWMHPPGRPLKCVAVLECPPIDSARKAVYSVIVKEGGGGSDLNTSSQFLEAVKAVVRRNPPG
jgi:hypothetical protein